MINAKLVHRLEQYLVSIRRDEEREDKGVRELAKSAKKNLDNERWGRVIGFLDFYRKHGESRFHNPKSSLPRGLKARMATGKQLKKELLKSLNGSASK